MLLQLRAAAADDELAIESLYRWLRDDGSAQGATIGLVSAGDGQQMGGLEVIEVVGAQVTAVVNLILAYLTWRDSRHRAPNVVVTLDGQILPVDTPQSVQGAVAAVLETRSPPTAIDGPVRGTEDVDPSRAL